MSEEFMKTLVVVSPPFWSRIVELADLYDCDIVDVPLHDDDGGPFSILSPRSMRKP